MPCAQCLAPCSSAPPPLQVILPAAVLVLRQVIATAVGEKKAKKVPGVALGLAAEAAWKVGTVTLQR